MSVRAYSTAQDISRSDAMLLPRSRDGCRTSGPVSPEVGAHTGIEQNRTLSKTLLANWNLPAQSCVEHS